MLKKSVEQKIEEQPVEETPAKETCVYTFRGSVLSRLAGYEAERYQTETEQFLLASGYHQMTIILNGKVFIPLPTAPFSPYAAYILIEFDDINYLVCFKTMVDMRNFMQIYGFMLPFIDNFLPDKVPQQRVLRYELGLKYNATIGQSNLFY